jgi:hypothetical protein
MTHAPPRILVHQIYEFRDGAAPVADHLGGDSLGDSNHLSVHHQDAVIVALQGLLNDDTSALCLALSLSEPEPKLCFIPYVDRYPSPVIAI